MFLTDKALCHVAWSAWFSFTYYRRREENGMLDKDDATLDELELLVLSEIEDEAEREKAVASIRALRDLLAAT